MNDEIRKLLEQLPEHIQNEYAQWVEDPIWDFGTPEPTMDESAEILELRQKIESLTHAEWDERKRMRHLELASKWGLPGNEAFGQEMELLLFRVSELKRRLNEE